MGWGGEAVVIYTKNLRSKSFFIYMYFKSNATEKRAFLERQNL
jgi:hypothetical protein